MKALFITSINHWENYIPKANYWSERVQVLIFKVTSSMWDSLHGAPSLDRHKIHHTTHFLTANLRPCHHRVIAKAVTVGRNPWASMAPPTKMVDGANKISAHIKVGQFDPTRITCGLSGSRLGWKWVGPFFFFNSFFFKKRLVLVRSDNTNN